jgi:hypothetical protein
MRASAVLAAVLALALLAGAVPAHAAVEMTSPLALPMRPAGHAEDGLLAQRTIDRSWGLSEDSTYHEQDVPGWKSEGFALALSGAVPGTGQLYSGEGSGWLYLLAESAGWVGRVLQRRRADQHFDDLVRFVGDPTDSSSGFSFERYSARTGSTADDLLMLWSGDRTAYYHALADNPSYAEGFSGAAPSDQYGRYTDLMTTHDAAMRRASIIEGALILNHIVSAIDALRVARVNNLPLREQYHLELAERWRHGRPELRAAVVRRF